MKKNKDAAAAKLFFRKAFNNNAIPTKVNIDKSGTNKAALEYFNKQLISSSQYEIRQQKYLNNFCEQDHRFIKKTH